MSEAIDLILFLSFFIRRTARYKSSGNCEGKGSMAAAACPFQYPAYGELLVTTHSSSIFLVVPYLPLLCKNRYCLTNVTVQSVFISGLVIRLTNSFD